MIFQLADGQLLKLDGQVLSWNAKDTFLQTC